MTSYSGSPADNDYADYNTYDKYFNRNQEQNNRQSYGGHNFDPYQGYGNNYGSNYGYDQRQRPPSQQQNPYDSVFDVGDISNGRPAFAEGDAEDTTTIVEYKSNGGGDSPTRIGSSAAEDMAIGIPGGMTTISVLAIVSFVCLLIFVFGLLTLLKKRGPDDTEAARYGAASYSTSGRNYIVSLKSFFS